MWATVGRAVAGLDPDYFGFVMATGIISVAAYLLGMASLAWALFYVNGAVFILLWLLTLARLIWHLSRLLADLPDPARGPGFLAIVAGTAILGDQFAIVARDGAVAVALCLLAVALWAAILYAFFIAAMVSETKAGLEAAVTGAWLMPVVATQAVSILAAAVSPWLGAWGYWPLFFALASYLAGCMLYLLIVVLVLQRVLFFGFTAAGLTPTYWIGMGAAAISTMAGSTLVLHADEWALLRGVEPFLVGFTLLFWSTASWWVPLLLLLGAWRHLYERYRLAYDTQFWGLVFPLGMYAACTFDVVRVTGLSFLLPVSHLALYAALLAWALAFAGLLWHLVSAARQG